MITDCPPGLTFLLNGHLYIVIACTKDPPEEILLVNLSSKRSDSDMTVIFQPGDHDFITRESIVRYSDARIFPKEKLIQRIISRDFELRRPFDATKLTRIQTGLLASPFTPKDKKEFYLMATKK